MKRWYLNIGINYENSAADVLKLFKARFKHVLEEFGKRIYKEFDDPDACYLTICFKSSSFADLAVFADNLNCKWGSPEVKSVSCWLATEPHLGDDLLLFQK